MTAWCPCPALTRPFRRALWGGRGPRGRAAPAPAARTGSGAPSAPPLPAVVWGPLRLCRVRSGGSSERSWAFICLPPPPSLEQVPVRVFLEERPPPEVWAGKCAYGGGTRGTCRGLGGHVVGASPVGAGAAAAQAGGRVGHLVTHTCRARRLHRAHPGAPHTPTGPGAPSTPRASGGAVPPIRVLGQPVQNFLSRPLSQQKW